MSLELISQQCEEIAARALNLQNLLKSSQVWKFYIANPEKQQALLNDIQIHSAPLVLWGMKNFYNSDILPENHELYTPKQHQVGDTLLTWASFYAGPPRVIHAYTENIGYQWHFLGSENRIRKPNRYDPFFRHYCLHSMIFETAKTTEEQIKEISDLQEHEIKGLNSHITLFETQAYRDL